MKKTTLAAGLSTVAALIIGGSYGYVDEQGTKAELEDQYGMKDVVITGGEHFSTTCRGIYKTKFNATNGNNVPVSGVACSRFDSYVIKLDKKEPK